jgi:Peptidase family M1 domain
MLLFYAFERGALRARLFRHAESDYTACMRARLSLLSILLIFVLTVPGVSVAAESSPRDTLAALNALQLDSQNVYKIAPKDRIELREADVVLTLEEGKLAFFQPFEGKITGFVFSGIGHVVALPRDSTEKQQMARFLGSPVLDQQFVSAYARFTDETAKDLLEQFKTAELQPAPDPDFTALWRNHLQRLNPSHSLRILFERYSAKPRHFFHAGMDGLTTGPFDILLDEMRDENLVLGQPRTVEKVDYYDVWASYTTQGFAVPKPAYDAIHYRIDTFIHPDNSLEGDTSVDFRGLTGGEQLLLIQLARSLKVESVSFNDTALPFFQNEGITQRDLRTQGSDTLCIFLPTAPKPGENFTVRFKYRGNIIEDAGNGVLFVGAREIWYPRYGDPAEFALYDMSLRWPKRLRLVATGNKVDEREDGDFHVGHWKTAQPVPEAGFNLGEYAVASLTTENRSIDVYANRQLEEAIMSRLVRPPGVDPSAAMILPDRPAVHNMAPSYSPPSPADALKQIAKEIDASIRFYERFSGPFPFAHLGVSQIPGSFGQGWPGLLYLSTFSFMPQNAQQKAGLTETNQELFSDIIPAHEVAHQWWGNVVGWSSYHDQWINESIAAYLALLFADSQKNTDRTVRIWLERHRAVLLEKSINEDLTAADVGPLIMGSRLSSSKSPDAYDKVIYSKGIWIFHMLHEMLRQPGAANPDARFVALLHTLVTKYAQKALTTADLQREVEAVMTPKMDLEGGRSMEWFFEQYVRGNGLPRYKVEFTAKRTDKGFQVKGTLFQSGVPRSFIAPVPLYANIGQGRSVLLGTVVSGGPETPFTFNLAASAQPHKIVIDPHISLLCVSE